MPTYYAFEHGRDDEGQPIAGNLLRERARRAMDSASVEIVQAVMQNAIGERDSQMGERVGIAEVDEPTVVGGRANEPRLRPLGWYQPRGAG